MERALHFRKHGHKFGLQSEVDYEQMADSFMFGVLNRPTRECTRPNAADRVRFNHVNRHFGVACIAPEFVRTFYPVEQKKVARHGGPDQFFAFECGRVNL
jgi:pyocin large subunit-like protein